MLKRLLLACAIIMSKAGATSCYARLIAPRALPSRLDSACDALSLPARSARPILGYRQLGREHVQNPGTISAGFTLGEVEDWRNATLRPSVLAGNSSPLDRLSAAKKAVLDARKELTSWTRLRNLLPEDVEVAEPLNLGSNFWFMAVVESSYRYILGDAGHLAIDVVLFLKSLEDTGEYSDESARISLRDHRGVPYRNLVAEYALHEVLEQTRLEHDEIIEITTRLFDRGIYLRPDRNSSVTAPPGTPIFPRAGQTPLGQALRLFIRWRLASEFVTHTGKRISLSFLDSSLRSALSIVGTAEKVISADGADVALRVLTPLGAVPILVDRIVWVDHDPGPNRQTFATAEKITVERIEQHLQAGFPVTLTEPQTREFIRNPAPGSSRVMDILQVLVTQRDYAAARLAGRSQGDAGRALVLWARAFCLYLSLIDLSVFVDDELLLNDDSPYGPFSFLRPGMRRLGGANGLINYGMHIANALLSYRHITLHTSKTGPSSEETRQPA